MCCSPPYHPGLLNQTQARHTPWQRARSQRITTKRSQFWLFSSRIPVMGENMGGVSRALHGALPVVKRIAIAHQSEIARRLAPPKRTTFRSAPDTIISVARCHPGHGPFIRRAMSISRRSGAEITPGRCRAVTRTTKSPRPYDLGLFALKLRRLDSNQRPSG